MIDRVTSRLASSYRLRLTLGYVAVTAVLALAWAVSLFGPLTSAITRQQETHLTSIARADALALETTREPLAPFVHRLGTADLRVTVVGADGTVLADTHNNAATMENHRGRPEIATALAGRTGSDTRRSKTEGVEQMYVAVPARYEGRPVALRVSESLASVASLAGQARQTGLALLAFAIVVSLFVTARLASSAADPVSRLAATARAIARGESRPVQREPGELGVVSDALADLASQVQQRIGESEAEQANLRSVLDGLDDAVILLDEDVIRIANGAASRMFKAPFGGWRGKRVSDVTLPASLAAAVEAARQRDDRTVEDLGPDPTGRTLRLTVSPLDSGGEGRRTLVAVADVTERMRLDGMRRDFVANASHELKTPASAIQLLAESAETAAADGDTAQALAFVSQMSAEAARLRQLVLDLLDLSRLESRPDVETLTDVRQAVSLAVTGHKAAADHKGLSLDTDLSAIEGRDVFAAVEPTDLAIALDNLLSNAVAYTERGGATVSVRTEGTDAVVTVTDTGVGIPADELPRVFERFYRVDRARSRESGGTGLGLSLVKHVVERVGGEVSVDSAADTGTAVTLRLPLAR